MDIRCDYNDIAKVCGSRSTNARWGIRTNQRRAIWYKTLPSRVRKILWLQALKYPHGVCAHLIHTKSSLDTERLKRKSLPWSRSIRARLGSITQVSTGLGQTPRRCYVGGAASSLSVTRRLDPLVSFPQIILRGAHVQLLDLCFGNPCPKLLTDCSSPCCQGWGTESSLCFEEVEVKYTFIFYCDLFRTTFYRVPCFIYRCFWKDLLK